MCPCRILFARLGATCLFCGVENQLPTNPKRIRHYDLPAAVGINNVWQEMKLLRQLQDNIAEISIGASALRSQGAPGVVSAARKYFKKIDLAEFSSLDFKQFPRWLDSHTEGLRKSFPLKARGSWGGARKGLNLFLRSCLYNTYLAREYRLEEKEKILEVPLDKDVATGLFIDAKDWGVSLPKWDAIKRLRKKESEMYQIFAHDLALDRGIARIHLDLYYWRRKKRSRTQDRTGHQ